MTRRLKVLLTILGVLCIVAVVNFAENRIKPAVPRFAIGGHSFAEEHEEHEATARKPVAPPKGPGAMPQEAAKPVVTFGSPSSPVKIEAYLMEMGGCHRPTLEALKKVAKKFKGKVHIKIVNMDTPKGQELASKSGVHCVTVLVDGRKTFKLPGPKGEERTVVLSGMVGASFTPDDIEEIVRRELAKKAGSSARGGAKGEKEPKGAGEG